MLEVGREFSEGIEGNSEVSLARRGVQERLCKEVAHVFPAEGPALAQGAQCMPENSRGSVWQSSAFQPSPVMTCAEYVNMDLQRTGESCQLPRIRGDGQGFLVLPSYVG